VTVKEEEEEVGEPRRKKNILVGSSGEIVPTLLAKETNGLQLGLSIGR
jgi:hypothetical protein